MWSKPWSYKEGLVIGAGLLVIGILLQMAVGAINWGPVCLSGQCDCVSGLYHSAGSHAPSS